MWVHLQKRRNPALMPSSASGSDVRYSSLQYESYVPGCRPSPHVLRVALGSIHRRVRPLRSAAGGASVHMRHCATHALSHIAPGISRLLSQEFSCTLLAVVQHHVAATDPTAIHPGRAWLPYRLCAALYLHTLGLQAAGPASFLAVRRFDSPSACWGNASGQSRVEFMDSRATRAACLSPFSMFLLSKLTCGRARLHAEGE
jgi:hypothetical protein